MKKLIVLTMALVFAMTVSFAFAAEEKAPAAPTTPAKAEEKVITAEKAEKKAKKKVKKAKKERKEAEKQEVEKKAPEKAPEKK